MTFTYEVNGGTFTDAEKVRFYSGDTIEDQAWLSDEEIDALISLEGTWQKATIAAIQQIIRKLSQPNFRADWLQVDNKSAREGYEKMLEEMRGQLGINAITATSVHVYRADSRQTEAPTYENGTTDDDETSLI